MVEPCPLVFQCLYKNCQGTLSETKEEEWCAEIDRKIYTYQCFHCSVCRTAYFKCQKCNTIDWALTRHGKVWCTAIILELKGNNAKGCANNV